MNRLLLHADDFGFNDAITRGIIEGFSNGLLTGASVLTNAPAAPLAVELWKWLERLRAAGGLPSAPMRHRLGDGSMSFDDAPFDLGVHLNLTQGRPLTAPRYADELLDTEGRFLTPGKLFLKLFASGRRWRATLNEELAAQIEWLLDHGLGPTHLNGHQYVEMMPVVGELIPVLAQRYGVGWVRAACEPGHLRHSLWPGLRLANCGLSSIKHGYAVRFRRVLDAAGIRHADAYFGASHAGRIDLAIVRRFLRLARSHAVSEIAFHPGQQCNEETLIWEADGWRDPLSASRPRELGLLGSTELSELILAANFRLTRFDQRRRERRVQMSHRQVVHGVPARRDS
ncbi:MAG TPA: ChbG/HpnK family deacetylase [Pirellulales bacterium]|jgi:predicted glycoside hydrolase/deacetylase ChbG (UPF0249 family)|nr:ChbG/HpnK family deacetylase [Pirellulales bacterium]